MKTSIDIGWVRVNPNPLIKELQKTQQEAIKEQFEKMEALLKECDAAS